MKMKILAVASMSVGTVGLLFPPAVTYAAANSSTKVQQMQAPTPPTLMAQSAILLDAENGQVLYQKDADERRAPASTTKLMTMFLVLKAVHSHQISWTDVIPVTPDAQRVAVEPGVSDAYLDPKEHFTLDEMMKFIAVLSANDATIAVADKIGGDRQSFVDEMNAEARTLGLKDTHYMNPDGLPEAQHYTTARDLALLSRALVTSYPDILQYTSLPQVTVRHGNTWTNTDELIGHYPGVDGLKTGYTADAGYCFVGTAMKNGRRMIAVVMGDTKTDKEQRFRDAASLFDYGFDEFKQYSPVQKNQLLTQTVYVANASDRHLQVRATDGLTVDLPLSVRGTVEVQGNAKTAPIAAGANVGTIDYVVGGQTIVSSPVVAAQADGTANWFVRIMRGFGGWIGHLLHHL